MTDAEPAPHDKPTVPACHNRFSTRNPSRIHLYGGYKRLGFYKGFWPQKGRANARWCTTSSDHHTTHSRKPPFLTCEWCKLAVARNILSWTRGIIERVSHRNDSILKLQINSIPFRRSLWIDLIIFSFDCTSCRGLEIAIGNFTVFHQPLTNNYQLTTN